MQQPNLMNSSKKYKLKIVQPVQPVCNEIKHLNNVNPNTKTKKKKTDMSYREKSKLWDIFDLDKVDTAPTDAAPTDKLECVYTTPKDNDLCLACNSPLMIMDDGFPTCTSDRCGIIYKDILDYSPEWRFYGADDKNANDPTRCGNPINPLLVQSSFGCKVLSSNTSSYEMKKIRKWTEWQSMPHKEKSLYDEFQFITVMAQNAGIPKIFIDNAMTIHKDISEQKMFRGLNRDGIKAASIYISCRLNGCPRTSHEIAQIFNLDKTSATTGCSMAVNILHNIECSRLSFNPEQTMLAKFITKKIEQQHMITDNIPHAIAAGIIFFVAHNCNNTITKHDIKVISGVSEVTINKCFKKLETYKDTLIPAVIREKYKAVA